jgi:dTDP-4-amino-4,6-dideoxygalactose transaminase
MKEIPFFNYSHIYQEHEEDYQRVLTETCRRGAYIMQQELIDFEHALQEYLGVKHAIGTADGTMALLTGLLAAGIGHEDEVIVPSHTFVASAAAVHHVGATPVLADCGQDHLIDPDSVVQLLNAKTKAIMPVQLNGRTANMESIMEIANKHDLIIVEDSCQALGSKFKGRFAGTFGILGAFSFYPSKTLGCFGDGGMVVTNDDAIAQHIRLLRDHGRGPDGKVWVFGFNARLDNIQAAVLNLKLKRYSEAIEVRRSLARQYHTNLKNLSELMLPPGPDEDPNHFDIFQNYEIEAIKRDTLRAYLEANGIKTIIQWGGHTIHQFEKLGLKSHAPYAEKMTRRFMLLPMNTSLSLSDVDYICETIHRFYGM